MKTATYDGKNYTVDGVILTPDQLTILQLEATIRLLQAVIVQRDIPDTDVDMSTLRLQNSGVQFNYDESPFDNFITVKWRQSKSVN
jgi:hypothetical protein